MQATLNHLIAPFTFFQEKTWPEEVHDCEQFLKLTTRLAWLAAELFLMQKVWQWGSTHYRSLGALALSFPCTLVLGAADMYALFQMLSLVTLYKGWNSLRNPPLSSFDKCQGGFFLLLSLIFYNATVIKPNQGFLTPRFEQLSKRLSPKMAWLLGYYPPTS